MVLTDKASAPTVRYRQGVDYDLNARTGLLRVRESCSADTVFLTADCESSDEQLVDALTASDRHDATARIIARIRLCFMLNTSC